MNCDGFCFDDYDPEEDDFEIQRLQDIISICEFLIKHKRNNKLRTELDELLDAEKDNKKKKEEKKESPYTINRYRLPQEPIWILPNYSPYRHNWWTIT